MFGFIRRKDVIKVIDSYIEYYSRNVERHERNNAFLIELHPDGNNAGIKFNNRLLLEEEGKIQLLNDLKNEI